MDKPICRMCGKPRNQSNLVKITPQVAFQIDYHCRISLFEDKTLPNKICFDCNYAISNFATYSETCKEVQLRMMMENDLHDIKVEIQELPVINEAPPNKESKKRKLQSDACVIADENKVKKDEDKVEKDEADDPEENGEDFENSGSDWKDSDNSSDSDYQTLAYKKRKKEKAASSPRPSRRGRKPTKAKPMDVEDPNEAIELDIPDCDKNDDGTISNNAGASYDGKKWSDRRLSCMECESVVYKGPYDLREHYSKEHPPQFEGFEKYRCEQCGDSDEAVVECLHKFVNHICEHQPFLKFCCLVCSEMYWNLDALHQHYEIAHEESNLHFCLLCGRFFKTAYYLASHETRLHKVQISREDGEIKMPHQQAWTVENLFADEISGDLFEKQNIFRLPASEKNADGSVTQECRDRFADKSWKTLPMNCTQCHVKMPSGYELSEHYNELHFNAKLRNFICSDCPEQKTFFNHESYVNHVFTIHHEHLRYCCFICNDIYWNYKALHQHFRTSHDEYKCLMCLHCGKYHKCGYDLKSHKEVHVAKAAKDDEIGIFKCHICTKSYSRKVQIQRHLETHKNERCWICETCGASFKSKSSLINHYMVHQTEKPFSCDVCGEAFKNKYRLKHHKGIHTGERKFACEVCGQRFRAQGTLKSHLMTHTGERNFKCEYCDKSFAAKYDLQVHTRLHTGEFTHECKICGERYPSWSNYSKHMRGRHQMDPRSDKKKKYDALHKTLPMDSKDGSSASNSMDGTGSTQY